MTNLLLPLASISLDAPPLSTEFGDPGYLHWLTNTIFVAILVTVGIIIFARKATAKMQIVPTGSQNFFESIIEGLYSFLESIVGKKMIPKTFGFLATVFIYIAVSNLFGLIPGVGTIGWGPKSDLFPGAISETHVPLFRAATSDLNMTFSLALIGFFLWIVWTYQEIGIIGFLKENFGLKGGVEAPKIVIMALAVVFFCIGIIELVSIAFRPVTLSFRLFGNIFAGENLLHTMMTLGEVMHFPRWLSLLSSFLLPLPFYFMELLVSVLQAFIFMLLCAVYIQLSTSHGDSEGHH